MSTQNQREYDFSLHIKGVDDLTTEAQEALFQAGCDDATLSLRNKRLYAHFTRCAESMEHAVQSAIGDVRRAGLGADVARVEEPSGR